MKVAVTGARGHMGRHVLAQRPPGCEVRSIDRVDPGELEPGADYRQIDIADLPAVKDALAGVDAVIHLAAIPAPQFAPPEELFRINVLGTYNVTLACEALGIRRSVFASSICYYGFLFRQVLVTPPYFPIDEDTPAYPEDSYSLSKRVGEEIMQAFVQRTGDGAVASLRYTFLAPDGASKGVPWDDSQDLSDEAAKSWWTYVDVDDAARATWQALDWLSGQRGVHEAFQIGADDTHTTTPTAELLARFFPGVADLRFGARLETNLNNNPYTALYSNAKARRVLGFQPSPPAWRNQHSE
jgi:nucleoside-diphosphate-sugar epimerase